MTRAEFRTDWSNQPFFEKKGPAELGSKSRSLQWSCWG